MGERDPAACKSLEEVLEVVDGGWLGHNVVEVFVAVGEGEEVATAQGEGAAIEDVKSVEEDVEDGCG